MALPKTPALTTDCVVFDAEARVLLIRRGHDPYAGSYALPGGFVEIGETVRTLAGARRSRRPASRLMCSASSESIPTRHATLAATR
jgi:8-oxo-dGTP diphosphatase